MCSLLTSLTCKPLTQCAHSSLTAFLSAPQTCKLVSAWGHLQYWSLHTHRHTYTNALFKTFGSLQLFGHQIKSHLLFDAFPDSRLYQSSHLLNLNYITLIFHIEFTTLCTCVYLFAPSPALQTLLVIEVSCLFLLLSLVSRILPDDT